MVSSGAEATTLAQSTLDALAGGSFEADGVMHGNPAVRAGGKLKIEGFKAPFDGEYVLTSVTHLYGGGDYRTKFSISGRHPRTLTDVMRPKPDRDWGANGLVIGLVTNNDDPEKLGRVRVKFPQLGDTIEGTWARIATPGGGRRARDDVPAQARRRGRRRPSSTATSAGRCPRRALQRARQAQRQDARERPARRRLGGRTPRRTRSSSSRSSSSSSAKEHMQLTIERGGGAGDVGVKVDDKIEVKAGSTITIEGQGDVTLKSTAGINVEATGQLQLKGATVDINGTAGVTVKGAIINIG